MLRNLPSDVNIRVPLPINRSFSMKSKFLVPGLVTIAMTFGSFVSDARADQQPIVRETGGLTYLSGGVGEESRQQLSAHASEFNLKLVFAMASGTYLSTVRVAITDAKGKAVLEATSDGPWFLAKLPMGNYRVVASYAGKAIERSVAVDSTALRTVDFRWDHE
ncbi:carboxypeptidase-like regulatory domain-containing protein [Accumulibacter sp.]|uniref:carboxypeptidase-like regulatory domain-containing protein n=1 Tax=Accumulibacter sp. TaxID=2053492 RepID=UPI002D1FB973|nr:carboxypeptidase-like regulatory domain-containing protein [Accumulibacter sp.]